MIRGPSKNLPRFEQLNQTTTSGKIWTSVREPPKWWDAMKKGGKMLSISSSMEMSKRIPIYGELMKTRNFGIFLKGLKRKATPIYPSLSSMQLLRKRSLSTPKRRKVEKVRSARAKIKLRQKNQGAFRMKIQAMCLRMRAVWRAAWGAATSLENWEDIPRGQGFPPSGTGSEKDRSTRTARWLDWSKKSDIYFFAC